jgi:hypothetical protein
MQNQVNAALTPHKRLPWNKGKLRDKATAATQTCLVDPDETPRATDCQAAGRWADGRTFWLSRTKLPGSYLAFSAARLTRNRQAMKFGRVLRFGNRDRISDVKSTVVMREPTDSR